MLLFAFQILEFDLKGSPLDSSSFIDVVVKDYETIGKDKYALCVLALLYRFIEACLIAQMHQSTVLYYVHW